MSIRINYKGCGRLLSILFLIEKQMDKHYKDPKEQKGISVAGISRIFKPYLWTASDYITRHTSTSRYVRMLEQMDLVEPIPGDGLILSKSFLEWYERETRDISPEAREDSKGAALLSRVLNKVELPSARDETLERVMSYVTYPPD